MLDPVISHVIERTSWMNIAIPLVLGLSVIAVITMVAMDYLADGKVSS